jgi:hypothetical protein
VMGGLRELEEELGLRVDPGRLVPLGTRRIEQEIPQGCDREFHDVFLLLNGTPPQDLRLQEGEVETVLRVGLGDVEALGAGVSAREYARGGIYDTRVSLADFVPNEDDYLQRVAGAARRVLAGEDPGRIF